MTGAPSCTERPGYTAPGKAHPIAVLLTTREPVKFLPNHTVSAIGALVTSPR